MTKEKTIRLNTPAVVKFSKDEKLAFLGKQREAFQIKDQIQALQARLAEIDRELMGQLDAKCKRERIDPNAYVFHMDAIEFRHK